MRLEDFWSVTQGLQLVARATVRSSKWNLKCNNKVLENIKNIDQENQQITIQHPNMIESSVPESRLNRLFHYTGLAVRITKSALVNMGKRSNEGLSLWSEANVLDLVNTLTKMRGAALKLGQMLSIQGSDIFPPQLEEILRRLRHAAHRMPTKQVYKMMEQAWGKDWIKKFSYFEDIPIAAASIGQVHKASMYIDVQDKSEISVAVKIQYPGVEKSLYSDLDQLKALLVLGRLLPKGLYLDNTIRVAQKELAWEVDYNREAEFMTWFRQKLQFEDPDSMYGFKTIRVPKVLEHTKNILITEWMDGIHIDMVRNQPSNIRNQIASTLLYLCLKELFEYGTMQTDPNWSNFLYNPINNQIILLDFGSSRKFPEEFINNYKNLVISASNADRESCIYWSKQIGFLTGQESQTMINSHLQALLAIAEPFRSPGSYDFSHYKTISQRVKATLPVMLYERQKPPPDETYSLHRKLSGAFLLCSHLKASVPCREMLLKFY